MAFQDMDEKIAQLEKGSQTSDQARNDLFQLIVTEKETMPDPTAAPKDDP